jgi:hypothetical protein
MPTVATTQHIRTDPGVGVGAINLAAGHGTSDRVVRDGGVCLKL